MSCLETFLSDKVSFVYSKMNPIEAVDDFINTILYVKNIVGSGRVLVTVLDEENAWNSYHIILYMV